MVPEAKNNININQKRILAIKEKAPDADGTA